MGAASDAWARLSQAFRDGDLDVVPSLYGMDSLYLEPYNPPHRGNLLIHAYLKDYIAGKDNLAIETGREVESGDGRTLGVEWTISYDAGGRRWSELPRASFLELDEDGLITYHRDYT